MRRPSLHLPRLAGALLASCFVASAVIAADEPQTAEGALAALPDQPIRQVYDSLPNLGSSANAGLNRAEEYQIGRLMMRDLRSQNALLDDAETTDYLQSLGSRIGVEAQDGENRLTFFAIRDTTMNAHALPGGFIVINAGTIMRSGQEADLAGVVAHEIGHVVQRHIARMVQAQGRISLTSLASLLGAVLIGVASGSSDAVPGLIALGQGAAMQQQINFTRMEEHEADRVGIGYLAAAGFDPNGMPNFFEAMMRERGIAGIDVPQLLLTHPVDSVRLAEARARVASMPPMLRRPDSETYGFIRERVRILMSDRKNLADLRRRYQREREAQDDAPYLRYAAALVELNDGNPKRAVELLEPLVTERPQLPLVHSALAEAQIAARQYEDAMASFEHGLALSPRNVPLTVRYAEALMTLNQAKKAHQILLDLFNNTPPTPEQIRLIAIAASAAGDTGDAYAYMAELHIANGDLMLADTQLDLALAAKDLTQVQRKRYSARQQEIRDVLRQQPRRRGGGSVPPPEDPPPQTP